MNKCVICGNVVEEQGKYACLPCRDKIVLIRQLERVDAAKKKLLYARERFYGEYDKSDYDLACETIKKKISIDGVKFNSKEEACFALQCEKEGITYYPNYKIENYKVDFLLPDLNAIVEIDGELYHKNEHKDAIRTYAIQNKRNYQYVFIRIPTKYIPKLTAFDLSFMLAYTISEKCLDGRRDDSRHDMNYFEDYLKMLGFFGGIR